MTTVDMADYWPNPVTGEQILVQDATDAYGPGTLSVLHRYRKGGTVNNLPVIQLDDYITTGWLDAWEYRFDATHGMIEVANKFPGKRQVYRANKWIPWGGVVTIGGSIGQGLEVDLTKSTGVAAGPSNYGWQSIQFEELIPEFTNDGGLEFQDVVKIYVEQSWCINAACAYPSGQSIYQMRYWLAPGLGFVQIDYILPTARRDYAKSVTKTVAMPL